MAMIIVISDRENLMSISSGLCTILRKKRAQKKKMELANLKRKTIRITRIKMEVVMGSALF